ncbi:hypothetical protein EPO56_00525 [Patescibacteria group bacterium]|nr:MAG: hypothetical protein EPO56_00525 [Patescibacteria group bacterium]
MNIFVGLLIVLLAWLLVNIMFSVLTGKGLDVWSKITCVANPTTSAFRPQGDRNVGSVNVVQGTGGTPSVSPNGGRCPMLTTGPCSPSNLTGYFGAGASNMSSICWRESGGIADAKSSTDKLWYDPQRRSFSVGLFQINLVAHSITCNGRTYQCPNAFRPPTNPNQTRRESWGTARSGAGFGYTIINEPLYNTCVAMASNPSCNLDRAANLYREANGVQPWVTSARYCGLL